MSDLLETKKQEHGKWNDNKDVFQAFYRVALRECDDLPYRTDHAELVAMWMKMGRILSKNPAEANADDWLDIAGYALLRFNNLSPDLARLYVAKRYNQDRD